MRDRVEELEEQARREVPAINDAGDSYDRQAVLAQLLAAELDRVRGSASSDEIRVLERALEQARYVGD